MEPDIKGHVAIGGKEDVLLDVVLDDIDALVDEVVDVKIGEDNDISRDVVVGAVEREDVVDSKEGETMLIEVDSEVFNDVVESNEYNAVVVLVAKKVEDTVAEFRDDVLVELDKAVDDELLLVSGAPPSTFDKTPTYNPKELS